MTTPTSTLLSSVLVLPALEDEVHEAIEENVEIKNGYGPARFIVEDGKVTAVEFKRCTQVLNENDRITVPADQVLVAIGQAIQWDSLLKGTSAELNRNKTLKVTGNSEIPGRCVSHRS